MRGTNIAENTVLGRILCCERQAFHLLSINAAGTELRGDRCAAALFQRPVKRRNLIESEERNGDEKRQTRMVLYIAGESLFGERLQQSRDRNQSRKLCGPVPLPYVNTVIRC